MKDIPNTELQKGNTNNLKFNFTNEEKDHINISILKYFLAFNN